MNSFEGIMARSGVARSRVLAVSVFSSFSNPMSRFGPRFSCWLKATSIFPVVPHPLLIVIRGDVHLTFAPVQSVQYPQFGFALWLLVGNG